MRTRLVVALITALLVSLLPAAPAVAAPDNPWLAQRVMNMAHAGGENEAPMNTMYAFKRAVALGADMIELDVQSTADEQLVVIHNAAVDETTNGTGRIVDMTLDQVRELDAAYWFVPGRSAVHGLPDSSYPLRGIRTGEQRPPAGYKRTDFAIPTLREVLRQFPDVPINIEIKGTSDTDLASFQRTGRLLSKLLNKSGRTDVIVASFNDAALVTFHQQSPQIGLSPGMGGLIAYFLLGIRPIDGTVALQVPVNYQGIPVVTSDFVARAHRDGYAVHVWFSGSAPDDEATYNAMIDTCADGLMPAFPTLLERILDERGIERPGQPGVHPCAS
ncbi:MAG TPA: glycerophosphodiester phosphodiesterase [Jatrophihabitantaceae bacterium]|nr:glycerophosphodiester phosphodiesterase [Jatrophihabitantaceae bacterium]